MLMLYELLEVRLISDISGPRPTEVGFAFDFAKLQTPCQTLNMFLSRKSGVRASIRFTTRL